MVHYIYRRRCQDTPHDHSTAFIHKPQMEGACGMAQRPQQTWRQWPGWSIISANDSLGFTLWFTGLHGTGKTTLAALVKDALSLQGYKVEIIDSSTLSYWLQRELHIDETIRGDRSHIP